MRAHKENGKHRESTQPNFQGGCVFPEMVFRRSILEKDRKPKIPIGTQWVAKKMPLIGHSPLGPFGFVGGAFYLCRYCE